MKLEGIENILGMQKGLAEALTGGNKISNFAMMAKAATAQQNKLRNMFVVPGLAQVQFKNDMLSKFVIPSVRIDYTKSISKILAEHHRMKEGLQKIVDNNPLLRLAKGFQAQKDAASLIDLKGLSNPLLDTIYTNALNKIMADQLKMKAGLQKLFDANPMLQFAKNIQVHKDSLTAMLKPIVYNIDPVVLENLSRRTIKAADITTEFSEKKYLTAEDFKKFESFVVTSFYELRQEIRKSGKSPMVVISFWIGIIGFLMMIFSTYIEPVLENKNEKEQPATKGQIEELKKLCEKEFIETIEEVAETITVKTKFSLRLKPKIKSLCIYVVHPDDILNVIAINHKWVYVSIIDKRDNVPVTGWVLKKCLR